MRALMKAAGLAAVLALGFTAPATADKGGRHGHHQKWEYDDGRCKYEYKRTPGVTKEKVKCRDGRHGGRHGGRDRPHTFAHARPVPVFEMPRAIPAPVRGTDILRCNRDMIGGVLGGIAGGLIGNQFGKGDGRTAATIAGGVVGVLVGGGIGLSIDQADMACVGQTLEYASPRQAVIWNNPDMGADYEVVPLRSFERNGGLFCREYQTRVAIGGRSEQAYGTACRMPDGDWKMVN